jgi:hypothetical protein
MNLALCPIKQIRGLPETKGFAAPAAVGGLMH